MFVRPKPGETEEDLLKLQDEFLKHKKQEGNVTKHETEQQPDLHEANISEQIANTFENIPKADVNPVRERCYPENETMQTIACPVPKAGFPKARKINFGSRHGQGSLFSQDSRNKSKGVISAPSTSSSLQPEDLKQKSLIDMKSEIHATNLNVISSMSREEIQREQEKYINSLDPALISFIKSRRKEQPLHNESLENQKCTEENLDLSKIEMPTNLLSNAYEKHWVGFDKVEIEKLAWMRNVALPEDTKKRDNFEARFDFKGWLLPYSFEEIDDKNRILYHHGEDPGRPGYTLQELFHLARSSVIQQRILALNTIANILQFYSLGVYENVIEIPIEQIFFVIRFCLDDNTPGVVNASLKAIHDLIVIRPDELCLDVLFNFSLGKLQPLLAVDEQDHEDYTENDQQVIEKNLIRCLVRSNILNRIRYILCTLKPCLEDVCSCLEILVRLARDSMFIFERIIKYDSLLDHIIMNFMLSKPNVTLNTTNFHPLPEAIKFVRILISRQKIFAENLVQKYPIIDALTIYLTDEQYYMDVNGLKIRTQSFNAWTTLIHYNIAVEELQKLYPVLMRLIHYYANEVSVEQHSSFIGLQHFSSLIVLLSEMVIVKPLWTAQFLTPLIVCLKKWSFCFTEKNVDVRIALSALFTFFSTYVKSNSESSSQLLATVSEELLKIVHSSNFSNITGNIKNCSALLSECESAGSSANFKTLKTAIWSSEECIIPIMQTNSCIPFLTSFSTLILSSGRDQLMKGLSMHDNIESYVKKLENSQKFNFIDNWFTRLETNFILNILEICVYTSNYSSGVYKLALNVFPVFDTIQKPRVTFILQRIIFNTNFISHVCHCDNQDSASLISINDDLNNITQVYLQVLNLNRNIQEWNTTLSVDIKSINVLPVDWMYSPLVMLCTDNKHNNISEESQVFLVKNCLKWICFYEKYISPVYRGIKVTERFCRLACVFLINDSLFLEPAIHTLLEECFRILISLKDKINFDEPIQGLSGFEDFYKQLLEQYQGVSYGDILFANVILIILMQKYNVKWRKILWSEYGGVVQTLNVTESQLMFNLEDLLYPVEEDASLLACYKKALSTNMVRRQTVLYKLACHHLKKCKIHDSNT